VPMFCELDGAKGVEVLMGCGGGVLFVLQARSELQECMPVLSLVLRPHRHNQWACASARGLLYVHCYDCQAQRHFCHALTNRTCYSQRPVAE
jgi:hypothetical protein